MKDQFIGMNIKKKSENKNTVQQCGNFLKSNFVAVNRLFVLVYSNQDDNSKVFKIRRHYLPKLLIIRTSTSVEKLLQ